MTSPVMKGIDIAQRPFFAICANIIHDDGTCIPTFMTFFQRYTNETHLWMGAGSYRLLMATDGGANLQQFKFLKELITNGTVVSDVLYCFGYQRHMDMIMM